MPVSAGAELFDVLHLVELVSYSLRSLDWFGPAVVKGLGLLAHPVRRTVLDQLAEERTVTRERLAERAAADEDVACDCAERLEVMLHHDHLPRLDDHQYVDYDERTGDVALWKDPETVESALRST